jgi:hypothetical protein
MKCDINYLHAQGALQDVNFYLVDDDDRYIMLFQKWVVVFKKFTFHILVVDSMNDGKMHNYIIFKVLFGCLKYFFIGFLFVMIYECLISLLFLYFRQLF